jgi:uncharacterized protein YbjQ (UPF0145 family)
MSVELVIGGTLLAVGLGAGRFTERRHLAQLARREAENRDVLVTDLRTYPGGVQGPPPALVVAETVISSDYFKSWISGLRRIIGGELRAFESLMMRARRESMAKLAEQARAAGFDAICNVRMEGVDITGGTTSKRGVIVVCLQASGTAYQRASAV